MSEERDDWVRRIELYLDVGSGGVVVLVDRARDAHIGTLVRALLRKHPDLSIAVSPRELRSAAKGSVVLYHAQPEDAEALNLIRPVLKDRALRVVLWAQGELASELPLKAPDLYDWISHRVLCPQQGAPRFASLGLLAAEAADRPVDWVGSLEELREAVRGAWPGMPMHVVSDSDYEALVAALSRGDGSFVAITQGPSHERTRVRWASARWSLAEAHRHARVAVVGSAFDEAPDWELHGFWAMSAKQADVRALDPGERRGAAVLELEPSALGVWAHAGTETRAAWWAECLDHADPGALLARLAGPPTWEAVVAGRSGAASLRAWGTDQDGIARGRAALVEGGAWRAIAIVDRSVRGAVNPPADVEVEGVLWRDHQEEWGRLADVAAELGHYDVAVHWELKLGSGAQRLAEHLERRVIGMPIAEATRLLELSAGTFEGALPDGYLSLRALMRCHRGDLAEARADRAAFGDRLDPATHAYLDVFLGDWSGARGWLQATGRSPIGPLRQSAVALAAWACNAVPVVAPALLRALPERSHAAEVIGWRWLPVLAIEVLPDQIGSALSGWADEVFHDAPLERAHSWLAASADAERRASHQDAAVFAARGIADLERAFSPREHVLEGVLLMMQGRALARLGQPDRAIDKLALADTIVVRTTENVLHPWALIARFEHAWLRAQHRGGPVEQVDAALAQLEGALWPEHRELREARKMRARLAPG